MLKFRDKRQILWLGSKFCGPRKTVGPTHHDKSVTSTPPPSSRTVCKRQQGEEDSGIDMTADVYGN